MAHDLTPISESDFGSLSVNDLLPERPTIIGEFSPAYEEFKNATITDLAPATRYEFILALQLVDLNWAILQLKTSADVSLAAGTERNMKHQLSKKLEYDGDEEYEHLLEIHIAEGGEEDEFEDPVDWDAIEENVHRIVAGLKSKDPAEKERATIDAQAYDVDPWMVLGLQYLNNTTYKRQTDQLADLEKRLRLLSGEYREIQKSRPIDVVSVSEG
jgi:hypothetical protein